MKEDEKLQEIARQLRNQKSKEWAHKNKDKIKEINKRYWLKKAREQLKKEKNMKEGS